MMNNKKDLNMYGTSFCGGGVFQNVSIAGAGMIRNDLECIQVKSAGISKIKGNIQCETIEVHGICDVRGDVLGEKVEIHGTTSIGGNIQGEALVAHGALNIGGNVKMERCELHGASKIGGSIEVGTLGVCGKLSHLGRIDGAVIKIEGLSGYKKVKFNEIRATDLHINYNDKEKSAEWRKVVALLKKSSQLVAQGNRIKADQIKMAYTKVKVVRGGVIEIGKGCEVDVVEYTDYLKVHKKAKVGTIRKIKKESTT